MRHTELRLFCQEKIREHANLLKMHLDLLKAVEETPPESFEYADDEDSDDASDRR